MTRSGSRLALVISMIVAATSVMPVLADGGDPSQVHACVNPAGQVRIVGPDDACRSRETALHLSGAPASAGMLVGDDSVPFDMPRGGVTSAVISFGSTFDSPPAVMITSTTVLRDVVVSVGAKTTTSFEIVLAVSANSSAPNHVGIYTFDWVAIAR